MNGEYKLTINTVADNSYDLQVVQPGILLQNGKTYRLVYDAYASANRVLNVNVGMPVDPYTTFLSNAFNGASEVNLTTSKQTFSFDFTMEAATYDNSRVEFSVGLNTSSVFVDNVSLFEVKYTAVSLPVQNKMTKQMSIFQNGSMVNVTLGITGNRSAFLDVYDMRGSVVYSSNFKASGSIQKCSFNTSGMPKGYYIIKAFSRNSVQKSGFILTGR